MEPSSSPSGLRPEAPHFQPDSMSFSNQPIPQYVPLYGTMHGTAYVHDQNCTTTGLPLQSAIQQAANTPQFPVRPVGSVPGDLELHSPELLAQLGETHRSMASFDRNAMILCRCDGMSRWVPIHSREPDHDCINTSNVGGGFRPRGEFPGPQEIRWNTVLHNHTQNLAKQGSEAAMAQYRNPTNKYSPTDSAGGPRGNAHHGYVSPGGYGSMTIPAGFTGHSGSPEAKERGRQTVKDLWNSAYHGYHRPVEIPTEDEMEHGAYYQNGNGEADGIPRLHRGRSM